MPWLQKIWVKAQGKVLVPTQVKRLKEKLWKSSSNHLDYSRSIEISRQNNHFLKHIAAQNTSIHSNHFITKGVLHSRLESQGQTELGALVDRLGIHLGWHSDVRLGTPFVLDQTTCLAKVVHACLHGGQWVQCMLCTNGDWVLVAREAMGHLSANSSVGQWAHYMVIWSAQGVKLVVPEVTISSSVSLRGPNSTK